MEIQPGYTANAHTLMDAIRVGRVCLLECTDKETGKPVIVLTALSDRHDGQPGVDLIPLAKMFDGNPYEELNPPVDQQNINP